MNKTNIIHPSIEIGGKKIGQDYPCFIIAEISSNHHQDFNEAVALVKAAARSGADAVKLQTSKPELLTLNSKKKHFIVSGKKVSRAWQGKSLFELYKIAYTPWDWYPKLKKVAAENKIILFSTPFGLEAVDFLERMNVPCYKIASYEALDVPLLRRIAKTKKPVIISHGFFNAKDIDFSLSILRKAGTSDIAVLHCVSQYANTPKDEEINLRNIIDLRERFNIASGFSDNNGGIRIPILAANMGAAIIEKHFILSGKSGGLDSRFSIEPAELKEMIKKIRWSEKVKGGVHYGPIGNQAAEIKRLVRSIYAIADIKKGQVLNDRNVGSFRPSAGLSPKYWDDIIGSQANKDIKAGSPITWKMISGRSN